MFSPFGMNCSPLGLAALSAQFDDFRAPDATYFPTGDEWREQYLLPLAQTDLLSDGLCCNATVIAVGREGLLKSHMVTPEERADRLFRLLLQAPDGKQDSAEADIVIDTTGVFDNPNYLGEGGIPAEGEMSLRDRICYHLPDVTGSDCDRYAGKHTLVVGGGYSAATSIVDLAALAAEQPGTCVTWLVCRPNDDLDNAKLCEPIVRIPHDPLVKRDQLAEEAN